MDLSILTISYLSNTHFKINLFYVSVIDMIHPAAYVGGEGGHGGAGPANHYGGLLPRYLEEAQLVEIHLIQIS